MINNKSIEVKFSNDFMKLKFLNGEILVPEEPGGYIIASGCGSGKTTAIREIIRNRWNEGILYSASTIKECNEMYDWVVNNLIGDSLDGYVLGLNDIILIHSETNPADMNTFRRRPELVASKRILICTHAKLLNELPEVIMSTNFVMNKGRKFNHHERINFQRGGYLPRQLMLIDELPTYDPMKVIIPKGFLKFLSDRDILKKNVEYCKPRYNKFLLYYKELIEVFPDHALIKGTDELSELKTELLLDVLYDRYDRYINSDKSYVITNSIADYITKYITFRILLFDGTGDLTFKDSERFKLLTYNPKYSSPMTFEKFEFNINRNKINILEGESVEESINREFTPIIDIMKSQINKSNKTLFITWMNLKLDERSLNKNYMNSYDLVEFNKINENFRLPDYLKVRLTRDGVDYNKFDIIHYQSGLDKATNEFRDYDSVVFLGDFQIPNSAIAEFNFTYFSNTDPLHYRLYQMVQAICRTRIRNHRGESIKVYYSSDISDGVINRLAEYFSNDNSENDVVNLDPLLTYIRPKWRSAIEILSAFDKNLKNFLAAKRSYSFVIDLDTIYELIPMNRKAVERYYPLINYLKKLNIELTITKNKYE